MVEYKIVTVTTRVQFPCDAYFFRLSFVCLRHIHYVLLLVCSRVSYGFSSCRKSWPMAGAVAKAGAQAGAATQPRQKIQQVTGAANPSKPRAYGGEATVVDVLAAKQRGHMHGEMAGAPKRPRCGHSLLLLDSSLGCHQDSVGACAKFQPH